MRECIMYHKEECKRWPEKERAKKGLPLIGMLLLNMSIVTEYCTKKIRLDQMKECAAHTHTHSLSPPIGVCRRVDNKLWFNQV